MPQLLARCLLAAALVGILPFAASGAAAPAAPAPGASPPPTPAAAASPAPAPAPPAAQRLLTVDDLFAFKRVDDPRLSPDGKWVAYTVETVDARRDKSNTQIYMASVATGEAQRLTAGDKSANLPRFSPDGRYLAFVSARQGCHAQVWLLNRLGGEAERVTSFRGDVADLAWSPDGRRLALVVGDPDPDEEGPAPMSRPAASGAGSPSGAGGSDGAGRPGGTGAPGAAGAAGGNGGAAAAASNASAPSAGSWASAMGGDGDGGERAEPGSEAADGGCGKDAPPHPIVIRRLQFMRDGEGYLRELRNHLYVFDLATRSARQITSGPYDDSDPAWSPDGKWVAFSSNRTADPDSNENSDIFVVAAAGGEPRAITSAPTADQSPSWSPDGTMIAYVEGGDPKDLWYGSSRIAVAPVQAAAAGAAPAGHGAAATAGAAAGPHALTAELDRNVTSPRFSPDGREVYFLVEEGGNSHLARVPVAGSGRRPIERVVDGERTVEAFDLDAHGDVAVLVNEPQRLGEVSLVTRQGLRRLTTVNDKLLAGLRLATVRRFQTKSADGTPVDGFLTLPPDAPAGARQPAVLRIHGGPTSQFDTTFHFEWQLLAAHGYVVVAANPRGSTGYGRDFAHALWADWGNPDFADVMAAVDYAVAAGVADPDRLGVGGWSYGGILTDYVITKTGRFKAAISGASETNFLADYGTDHYQYAWETELGLPWRNVDRWVKLSPWFQVEKITTPTLLLCGTDDQNVPALNSEQLYEALRRLGRDTELVLYPGQTHSLNRPSFLKDRFQRYLAWYDKYLKPGQAAASTPAPAR